MGEKLDRDDLAEHRFQAARARLVELRDKLFAAAMAKSAERDLGPRDVPPGYAPGPTPGEIVEDPSAGVVRGPWGGQEHYEPST